MSRRSKRNKNGVNQLSLSDAFFISPGWVYGGQGTAGSVMHPQADTVYALAKWSSGGVTVIKDDDDKARIAASDPDAGCVNPVNGYAYIANTRGNNVLVIDDLALHTTLSVGSRPNSAVCASNGYVYIVNSGSNPATVSIITGTQVITAIPVGQSTTGLGVDGYWGVKLSGSTNFAALDEDSGYLYVANWGSDTVSIISGTAWLTDVVVGDKPNAIGVYTPTNTAYVANVGDDTVSVISGNKVIAAIPVGDYPIALAVNASNGYVYVTNRDSDSVSIIQGTQVVATIERSRPQALAAQKGQIYSANENGAVSVVEGANLLAAIPVGLSPRSIIGDGSYIYAANAESNSVSVISGTTPIAAITVGSEPRALAVYTPANRVYVANTADNTVSVLKNLTVETTIAVGGEPIALAADPDSGNIFVANRLSNTVTIINGTSQIGVAPVGGGPQALTFNTANAYLYAANTASNTVSILSDTALIATRAVSAAPVALAANPDTGYVYAAAYDDDAINVLQGLNVVATIPVGDQPNAIAIDRNLGFVYVTCEGDDRVWVLSGTVSLDLDFGVGEQPVDVVIQPAGNEAYIANYGGVSLSRVENLAPSISALNPDRSEVGRGITVTLSGGGYFLTPTVKLDNIPLENVERTARDSLNAWVPDTLSVGEYTVTIRTADGLTGAKTSGFMVTNHEPTVTLISPDTFANDVTATVRITGSGFISTPAGSVGDAPLQNVVWLNSGVITAQIPPGISPGRYQSLFFDNIEQDVDHWSPEAIWQLTTSSYHSSNRAWVADASGTLYLDIPLDLTVVPNPQLSFWERRSGFSYDHAYVEISTDGGQSWQILRDAATSTNWQQTTLDLSAYAASLTATLRFRISGYIGDGWYIDDVHIGSMPDSLLISNPGPGNPAGYLSAPFTVTNRAHYFVIDSISSPQVTGQAFSITITAYDAFDYQAQDYAGMAALSATAPVSPAAIGPFTNGVWSGMAQVDAVQSNVIITVADAISNAISGSSVPFDVSAPIPLVSGVSPATLANDVTATLQIIVDKVVSTPTVFIGNLPLSNVIQISQNLLNADVPPGLKPGLYQTLFFDNLEQNTDYWSPESIWQITSSDYHSQERAWRVGYGSSYGSLYLDIPLDLSAIPNPQLLFWERRSGYWYSDHAYVEISVDGRQSWQTLSDSASAANWQQTTLDLSAYAASPTATLRFRASGYFYSGQYWYIDDIHVGSMPDGLLVTNPGPGSPTGYLTAPFTISNQASRFIFEPIASPQLLDTPFTITISAVDFAGFVDNTYTGAAALNAPVPINPSVVGPFIAGVWRGSITLTAGYINAVITASDTISPAISGGSNLFDVLDPNLTVLDVFPTTISNNITTTLYITGNGIVPTPAVRIGRETISGVTIVDSDTIAVQVPPGLAPRAYGTLLYDSVERDTTALWQAEDPWTCAANSAHNAAHSWEAAFTDAMSASLTLSNTLDLTALSDPILDFWYQLELEDGDAAFVELSTEPNVWLRLKAFTAVPQYWGQALWGHTQLDLRSYASHSNVRLRFRIYNQNGGGNGVRWRLDDIAVTGAAGGVTLINPGEQAYADMWRGDFSIVNQAAQFDVELAPDEQVAGVPFSITLTARDASGYVVANYNDDVALSASSGNISPTIVSGFVNGSLEVAVQLDVVQDSVVITASDSVGQGVSQPFDVVNQERAAYIHLEEELARYDRFWLYSDGGAYANHYGISYMGVFTDVEMNAFYTATVHSGATAIQATYTASDTSGERWGGAAWLDPEGNWGDDPGGYYLQGATELVFWAKGETGGERITFGMGGVPTGVPARRIVVALTDQWQRYAISLNGLDLERVVEGFYWAADSDDNPGGVTFYLDDIHYHYQSSNTLYVYKDQFSPSNFYVPSGWMGDMDQLHVDEGVPDPAYPGATVTRFTYDASPGGLGWAGIYYQWPDNNWGTNPDGGHDLSGATKLVFRARGEQGNEKITFGMGGTTGAYGDSTSKHERYLTLSAEWQEYIIDLSGYDLSRIVGGFYWSASRFQNPNGATFYVDDIRYVFDTPSWPHLIPSYVTDASQPDDKHFAGSAHVYDNALAILAFLARGQESDLRRARDIADALLYAQDHDPYFSDGRLRNVYHAETLSGSEGVVWYWNDAYGAGSHVGNMSWAALTLARMYQATNESKYLDAAARLGDWIYDHTYDTRFYGGYRGGYDGWGADQKRNDWKSTEHNIDAYIAFALLYDLSGEAKWWQYALHAKQFTRSMWLDSKLEDGTPTGWFWTGTKGDFLVYGDWEPTIVISSSCQSPYVTMPNNHYYPAPFGTGMNNLQLNLNYTATVHAGQSSIHLTYTKPSGSGQLDQWVGMMALEGDGNWGTAGPGHNMIGIRSLTLWMKGVAGGETAVIGIGGVPYTSTVLPISSTLPGTYAPVLSQTIALTAGWQPYTITVPPTHTLDMAHHIGGFFAYLTLADNPEGAEIFLDDIVYRFDDPAGEMLDYNVLVADVNSWGLMALGESLRYSKTVEWLHHAFLVTETIDSQIVSGFDFDIDKDHVWYEGTGQALLAFQMAGREEWNSAIRSDVVFAQEHAPRANRKGIVAALDDCLTTNLGWFYYNRLHVAPTAWYIFAAREHNPYWGIPTLTNVPHQGPIIQSVAYQPENLTLTGYNFNAPTVALRSPLSSTLPLDVQDVTSTTLTAVLVAPLPAGITYTISLTNTDTQSDQKAFLAGCVPPNGAHFIYLPLALRSFMFTATVAEGHPPFTYTWDFDEAPLILDGVAYGPFRDGQRPGTSNLPTEAEIQEDLDILSRHTSHIRLYGAGETAPDIVRLAAEKGISVTLGAWIDADPATNELELASLVSQTSHYSNVVAAVVGNERLLFHEISETQLITYIQQVQQAVDVPVSTAETWDVWLDHPQLAAVVDYLLVHIHPYWGGAPVDESVALVAQLYAQVQAAYPDKPIVIGETGWPTDGDIFGAAHPGEAAQQQFIETFTAWAAANNVSYFYFDFADETWKCNPGPAVECHWGLFTTARQPKQAVATNVITTVPSATYTFPRFGSYTVTLTISNSCGSSAYSETIVVASSPGVELAPNYTGSANPGSAVTHTHTLTNTGNYTDVFDLDIASSQDWPVTLLTTSPITLAQNATATVQIHTIIPAGVISGAINKTVVTAASQSNNDIQAAVTDTIVINRLPGLEFTPDNNAAIPSGTTVAYTHTLSNTGNYTDTYNLAHHSKQDWIVRYNTPLSVGYAQTATVIISVTVPANVSSGVVDTSIITAVSQADSSVWAKVTNTATVTEQSPAPPFTPTLLSPADKAVITTTSASQNVAFIWQAGSGAAPTGYNLQLDGNIITATGTTTSTILSTGVHTWTARAFNAAGYSNWATAWTIEVRKEDENAIYLPLILRGYLGKG